MKDIYKSKKQLIKELEDLRRKASQGTTRTLEEPTVRTKANLVSDAPNYKRDKESLLLIRKAIDSATDAIGLSDPEGHHVYQNKAFTNLFEYTVEELESAGGGRAAFAVKSTAREVFGSIMSGRSWSGEVEMKAKSGRIFSLYLRANAVKDDAEKIVGLVEVFTDITERKRLEYQLRKQHDELQLILDSIPAYVFYKDKDGKMLNINKAAIALAYSPKEKLLQKTVFDLMPEMAEKYNIDDMAVISSGQPKINIEEPLVLPSGTRWLKTDKLPIKDDDGNIVGLLGFSVDITELKVVQEDLREKEALLNTFFNSPGLICGIVELEIGDLRYIAVNAEMAAMYGLKPEDVSNKLASEIGTDRGIVELFIDNYKKSQKKNAPAYFEYHRGSGSEMQWLFVTVTFLGLEPIRYRPRFAFVTSDITERRRVEETLRDSEQKLRVMFESMTDAVVLTDLNGVVLDVNTSVCKTFGYSKDELIGLNSFNVVAPEDKERAATSFARVMDTSEIGVVHEYKILDKNGRRISAEINANMLSDIAGKPYGLLVVIRDVTSRKLVEEALRKSEQELRLMFQSIKDGIFVVGLDGNVMEVNAGVEKITGYSQEQLIGKSGLDHIFPGFKENAVGMLGKVVAEGGTISSVELPIRTAEGEITEVEANASVLRDISGNPIGLIGVVRDISERKNAERALSLSEKRYRDLYEGGRDGWVLVAMDGRVVESNNAYKQMLGYTDEELKQKTYVDLTPAKWHEMEGDIIKNQILVRGYSDIYEKEYIRKDGRVISVELRTQLFDEEGTRKDMWAFVRDITERKRMEGSLRDSEEKLRLMFASMADGVVVTDIEGKIIDTNEAQLRMFGFKERSELIGKGGFDFLAERERGRALADMFKVYEKGFNTGSTYIVVDKDGREFECELSTAMLHDTIGKPSGTVSVMRDVTERKRMEQAVRESEERYRLLAENVSDVIWMMNLDLKYQYVSPSIKRMRGFTPEEFIGISAKETLSEKSFTLIAERLVQELEVERSGGADPGRVITLELEMKKKDGSWMWAEVKITFMRDSEGKAIGILGVTRDISERKRVEEALREASEKLQVIFDSIGEAVTVVDIGGNIVDANKEALRLHGFDNKDAIIGRKASEMVAPVDRDRAVNDAIKAWKSPYPSARTEYKLIDTNGREFDGEFNVAVIKDNRGKPSGFIGIARDISERKRAEALQSRLAAIVEFSQDAIMGKTLDGIITSWNRGAEMLYGYTVEEIIGRSVSVLAPTEHVDEIAWFLEKIRRGEAIRNYETVRVTKDGRRITVLLTLSPIKDVSGKVVAASTIAQNITERKKMEEALKKSEEYFKEITENSSDMVIITDKNGDIKYCSRSIERFAGYKPEELIDKSAFRFIHPDDVQRAVSDFGKAVLTKDAMPNAFRIAHKDGSVRFFDGLGKNLLDNPAVAGFIMNIRDVTERKQMEEALRETEERYRSLFDRSLEAIYISDLDGNFTDANPYALKLLGYEREDILSLNFSSLLQEEAVGSVYKLVDEIIRTGSQKESAEYKLRKKDGTYAWVENEASLLYKDGKPVGIQGVGRDITERKRMEEALRNSEEKLRVMFDSMMDGIVVSDPNINIVDLNRAAIEMISSGTKEELLGRSVMDIIRFKDQEKAMSNLEKMFKEQRPQDKVDYSIIFPNDKEREVEVSTAMMHDNAGNLIGFVNAIRDISERKRWEDVLKKSEEKYRNLVEREKDVICSVDPMGFVRSINSAVAMWGYTADEVLKMHFLELIAPEWREVTATQLQARLLETGEYVGETMAIKKDGEECPIEYSAVVIQEEGKYVGAQAIVRDISERKKSEEALQAKERYFRAITDLSSGAALVVSGEGNVLDTTGGLERISGYSRDKVLGISALEFIHPEELEKAGAAFDEASKNVSKTVSFEARLKNAHGAWQWTECLITNLLDHPDVRGIVTHLVDITERKKAEEDIERHTRKVEALYGIAQVISQASTLDAMLKDSLDRVCSAIGTESGCIFMLDLDENALKLSACKGVSENTMQQFSTIVMTEQGMENLVKLTGPITDIDEAKDVIEPEKMKKVTADIDRRGIAAIPFFRGKDLQGLIVTFTKEDRTFGSEDLDLLRAIANEVSIGINNMMLLEKTKEMSVTDELTGLYNRRYFFEMMEVEMNRTGRTKHPFSLVMLDLDGFKEYNDKYGHTNGDTVLQTISQMLKSSIRKSDMAFRYGGDEFALILPSADAGRAKKIVQRARAKWQKAPLAQSKIFGGHVGFSTGIAEYPENAESSDGLIFLADAALYQAKKKGYEDKLVSELRTLSTDIMDVATQDQVYALAATVDARDPYTYGHSQRVAEIAMSIGKQIGMSVEDLSKLQAAALLHDIGKVGVPDAILTKMGKPTPEEWDVIKKHCSEGARIVSYVKELASLVPIILHHHEWYDGSGYPGGLKGMDIPSGARITGVADAYDTMVTKRPYREVISPKEACEELERNAGTQFDPVIVDVWSKLVDKASNKDK